MTYISVGEAESYVRSGITADIVEIEAALLAACEMIDTHCVRTFTVPTVATTRTFPLCGSPWVPIDDIADPTGIVVDNGSVLTVDGYRLYVEPGRLEQVGFDGVKRPFSFIGPPGGSWSSDATVTITAKFGWPDTVPERVKIAAKMLTKDILASRDTRFGFVQVGDFSRRVAENATVASLLYDLISPHVVPFA